MIGELVRDGQPVFYVWPRGGKYREGQRAGLIALRLQALSKVDTRKCSLMWDRRCVVLGKMQKSSDGVNSTAAQLLKLANVELPLHMRDLERRLAA